MSTIGQAGMINHAPVKDEVISPPSACLPPTNERYRELRILFALRTCFEIQLPPTPPLLPPRIRMLKHCDFAGGEGGKPRRFATRCPISKHVLRSSRCRD